MIIINIINKLSLYICINLPCPKHKINNYFQNKKC